jgi:hypothetical protein
MGGSRGDEVAGRSPGPSLVAWRSQEGRFERREITREKWWSESASEAAPHLRLGIFAAFAAYHLIALSGRFPPRGYLGRPPAPSTASTRRTRIAEPSWSALLDNGRTLLEPAISCTWDTTDVSAAHVLPTQEYG